VNNKLTIAETLPGSAYGGPGVLERERERVFSAAWLPLPAPPLDLESVLPFELLPGFLNEPLVLTRDGEGGVQCMSNVCTHRGMLVACSQGPMKRLRCTYHGRRFDLHGALEAAPGFEGAENFPRPEDDLPKISMGSIGPLWFGNLDSNSDFGEWISSIMDIVGFLPFDELKFDADGSQTYTVEANWKLYIDNYLEGFHISTVHKSLAAALNVADYRVETLPHGSLQVGVVSNGQPELSFPEGHRMYGQSIGALYFHMFPNTLMNVYPWGISMNHVNPIADARTEVHFRKYVWRPDLLDIGAGAGLDRVEMEDEAVVEATQKGIRGRLYKRGRYAPSHEAGVHHFHLWWTNQFDD
jgi:choline monooxygenase